MPIIELPRQRHTLQDEGFSLRITIPSRKSIIAILFLGFWLTGWSVGEFAVGGIIATALSKLIKSLPEIPSELGDLNMKALSGVGLFLLVWFTFWTFGGISAIYSLLWQLVGRETIEVTNDTISLQRGILGLGRTRDFPSAEVRNMRFAPGVEDRNLFQRARSSNFRRDMSGGLNPFDYGAKTFRFASGVDEAEARQILEEITSRFPQYRSRLDGTR